jgi:RNA polymerase sigma factor (sigma-70 family)
MIIATALGPHEEAVFGLLKPFWGKHSGSYDHEDLLQEGEIGFIEAHLRRPTHQHFKSYLTSYVRGYARMFMAAQRPQRWNSVSVEFDVDGIDGEAQEVADEDPWARSEARIDCQKLHGLPVRQRELLMLYYVDKLTSTEIMNIFGFGLRTFWTELKKATETARDLLSDLAQ